MNFKEKENETQDEFKNRLKRYVLFLKEDLKEQKESAQKDLR